MLHLQRNHPQATEQELRDYLGGYGFRDDRVFEPVAPFSGGEKARLVLALIIRKRPNLLLLDEPTNHLDLEMRHALAVALQEFEGALVVVSHDRFLLEGVADRFLLVADQRVEPFPGDLDDYGHWIRSAARVGGSDQDGASVERERGVNRKDQRRLEAEQRKQLAPLKRKISHLEQEIEKLEAKQSALEEALAGPEIYKEGAKERLRELLQEKGRVDQMLAGQEEKLLELYEELG